MTGTAVGQPAARVAELSRQLTELGAEQLRWQRQNCAVIDGLLVYLTDDLLCRTRLDREWAEFKQRRTALEGQFHKACSEL